MNDDIFEPKDSIETDGKIYNAPSKEPSAIKEQLKGMPWWMISVVIHAVLLAIFSTIVWSQELQRGKKLYHTKIRPRPKLIAPKPKEKRDLFESDKQVNPDLPPVENPVVTKNVTIEKSTETFDQEKKTHKTKGIQNAISDLPYDDIGTLDKIGLGPGAGGPFGWRDGGGRGITAVKEGGSRASESAVEKALEWLAKHQDQSGGWDGDGFNKHCPSDMCSGVGNEFSDAGMTGLALLSFLGAGYTHKSGKWKNVVKKAIDQLIAWQDDSGYFNSNNRDITTGAGSYSHPMAAMAMVEAYGMTRNSYLRSPGQKAINFITKAQKGDGGWRYTMNRAGLAGLGDTSVTGWYVMALKSAKVAGLNVPNEAFLHAKKFIDGVGSGKHGGLVRYVNAEAGQNQPTPNMVAVGMLCRQFMGAKRADPALVEGAEYIMTNKHATQLMQWPTGMTYESLNGNVGNQQTARKTMPSMYYWYYGSLSMFQMGGQYWDYWNRHIRDILVKNQCTQSDGHKDGSWDPISFHTYNDPEGNSAKHAKGGRIFSTTLCVLSLEVYYRYLPMYR